MWNYWQRIHKHATLETRALLGLDTGAHIVIRIVVAIVGISILWVLGSEQSGTGELKLKGAATLAILSIFPCIYVWKMISTPAKINEQKDTRIAELQHLMEPELAFSYEPREPWVYVHKENDRKIYRIHRLLVDNKSETKTIKDVSVSVFSITGWAHAYPNVPLLSIEGQEKFDLDPKSRQYVNMFKSFDGKKVEEFQVMYAKSKISNMLPRDPKEIQLQVRGLNTPSVFPKLKTGTTGGGKLTIALVSNMSI